MSSRDKKDARRVQADFEFDEVGVGGAGGGGRRRRGGGGPGGGNRDPSSQQNAPAGPSRPNNGRGRGGFSGNLTVENGTSTPTPPGPSRRASPSPPPDDPIQAQYVNLVFSLYRSPLILAFTED